MLTVVARPRLGTFLYLASGLLLLRLTAGLARATAARRLLTRRTRFSLAALVLSLCVSLGIAEVALRLVFKDSVLIAPGERNLGYRYDERLGWLPIPNSQRRFTATRTVDVHHNSKGLRGPERVNTGKPAMIFLGDSFVWGYDAEVDERFTERLQARHPDWTIWNFGVSGYGTDQEFLLLQQWFDEYSPRLVVTVYCAENDRQNNSCNFSFGCYKPYFTTEGSALKLNGVPVPRSTAVVCAEHSLLCQSYVVRLMVQAWKKLTLPPPIKNADPTCAIISAMQQYVHSRGALFALALEGRDPGLERFLADEKIPYVDLSQAERYPSFGNHWTPAGHLFVCNKIDQFLTQYHYLEASSAPADRALGGK